MNLKQKLFVPLLLIVTIPVLLVGGLAYRFIVDVTKSSLTNGVRDVTQSLAPALNEKILTADTNLRFFSRSRLLQNYISRGDERYAMLQASLIRQLTEYQNIYPDYITIKLLLENGEIDSMVDNRKEGEISFDASQWEFYQHLSAANNNDLLAYIEQEPVSQRYIMSVGLPLIAKPQFSEAEGSNIVIKNYLTLSFYLDYMGAALQGVQSTESNNLLVVDANNNILFSNPSFGANSTRQPTFNITENQHGIVTVNETNEPYHISSLSLAHELKLFALVPTAKFNQSANELAREMILFFVAAILTIFIVSVLYIQNLLLRPIYSIKKLVSDIAKGNMESVVEFDRRNDELGELSNSIIEMREEIKGNNQRIEKLAYFDELTNLPNRITMQVELETVISRCKKTDSKFALIFLDLDNFKDVNDTLGHDVGDQLLVEAATRIKNSLNIDDYFIHANASNIYNQSLLARLGGDEFTVIIADFIDPSQLEEPLTQVIKSLSQPFSFANKEMTVGVSIGIAIFPEDGQHAKELLKSADLAMYEAKRNGKNCFAFFNGTMNEQAFERQTLETALRNAELNQEFSLHYQPRMKISDYSLEGFEALIRWHSKDLGAVSPLKFIPVAEANLQIIQIGRWVLNQACIKIKHWRSLGYDGFRLSINVSPVQLHRDDLVAVIQTALETHAIEGKYLEIEITESVLLEDQVKAISRLNEIRQLDVRIALDDFGTGYSSLSHIRSLPIDILKIDRSFILDITKSEDSASVFEAIVQLAKRLSLITVAEGVEMGEQHEVISIAKCDYAQGYYYAKPLIESAADDFIEIATLKKQFN